MKKIFLGIFVSLFFGLPIGTFAGFTIMNTSSTGVLGNGASIGGEINSNGRYIVFASNSYNYIAPGGTNGMTDIYMKDKLTNITTRISSPHKVTTTPTEYCSDCSTGPGMSRTPDISDDGRYIAFTSKAFNLVSGDYNDGTFDIFVKDMQTFKAKKISGNADSTNPRISGDGKFVAFISSSTNLVPGDTNWQDDVFVKNLINNSINRISVSSDGNESNGYTDGNPYGVNTSNIDINYNGRYIVFISTATNLVADDTNGVDDVFLRDTLTNTTTRISVDGDGKDANGSSTAVRISSNGRYIAFISAASNLVAGDTNGTPDVFLRDTLTNTTTRVSVSDGEGSEVSNATIYSLSMDGNGQYILFDSTASNLVEGDTNGVADIFVRDVVRNRTIRVSSVGTPLPSEAALEAPTSAEEYIEANNSSLYPMISADGNYMGFTSWGDNLTRRPADTNGQPDVFIRPNDNLVSTTLLYTDPNGVFSFEYLNQYSYKNSIRGSLLTTFTLTGQRYSLGKPLINISQAVTPTLANQSMSLYALQNNAVNNFRRLMKNTLVTTIDVEKTADGTPIKQMHFTGKIGGVTRTYVVVFIKRGIETYVITANGDSQYSASLDEMVDTIISTRTFLVGEIGYHHHNDDEIVNKIT